MSDREMWPRIMAATAAGKMKESNPQIRLAIAFVSVAEGVSGGAIPAPAAEPGGGGN
jgi:hypothetical protein